MAFLSAKKIGTVCSRILAYAFFYSQAKLDKTYNLICVDYIPFTPHLFGLALPFSRGGGNRTMSGPPNSPGDKGSEIHDSQCF
jgi:hypothetical protein